jgi:hypothetical protein
MKTPILPFIPLLLVLSAGPALAEDPADEAVRGENDAETALGDELTVTLQVPLLSPHFTNTPVAIVDDEPITVADLTKRVASIHAGRTDEHTPARKNYANLLDRVITTKLIVQEARNIGFDEMPAVAAQIEQFSADLLLSILMSQYLESVEPDPEELDELYRQMSREFLLTTLNFANREDANAFVEQYESSGDFQELAAAFIEDGRTEGELDAQEYMKLKDLLPRIAQTAYDMEVGSVSEVFLVTDGLVLFYVDDIRFYEDPALEKEARQKILGRLKKEKGREYGDLLVKKHATTDEKLLKKVDFQSEKTGFLGLGEEKPVDLAELIDDERVVANMPGEEPFTVTIGDLATAVKESFYHGIETSTGRKKDLNREKRIILQNILFARAAVEEAMSQGIHETDEYLDTLDKYTTSLLFETFLKRVIIPDVKITEEEVRSYYEEHIDDFSSPKMIRMNGIAFHELADAQKALDKLRKGADFKWVSANSPGQVTKGTKGITVFDNVLLSSTALPDSLRKPADMAKRGDSLLYSDPDDYHHVITISKIFPPTPRRYEDARLPAARQISDEKTRLLIEDWGEKLKEEYDTRIFVTGFDD